MSKPKEPNRWEYTVAYSYLLCPRGQIHWSINGFNFSTVSIQTLAEEGDEVA